MDFDKILSHYSIGGFDKLIKTTKGNTITSVIKTKNDEKYVIKVWIDTPVSKYDYRIKRLEAQERLKDELELLVGMKVNRLIRTNNDELMIKHDNQLVSVITFLKGKIKESYNKKLHMEAAKLMGLMHNKTLRKKIKYPEVKPWYSIKKWMIKESFYYKNVAKEKGNQLISELKEIDFNKLRKSIVHGDLHADNLIVIGPNEITFIDWDGLIETYLLHDLAYFLVNNYLGNGFEQKAKSFIKAYQENNQLTNYEKETLYYFIKYQILRSKRTIKHYKFFVENYSSKEIFLQKIFEVNKQ